MLKTTPTFILIAEDDIDDQEMIHEMIIMIDPECKLEFISKGGKVMSYLESLQDGDLPNLILLDFNLPEFTGIQLLQQMGEIKRYESIPKILWSTSKYSVLRNECLQFGADDFLVKPSSLQELENLMSYVLSLAKNDQYPVDKM
ncbi:MAG TPA: response regulator [Chitinophagaceae bacterium]|nr:response regulator [Chitinophagaceae bacterium]